VRHSAGEVADGLHLLGLAQLLFGPAERGLGTFAFSDVT
jgi:hypothetical protein